MAVTLRRGMVTAHGLWWLSAPPALTLPDFSRAEPVYEGTYTQIWRHPDVVSLISKLSWVKTAPRDNLRKYWASQARREIIANRIMRRLGLTTAHMLGYGVPVAPWARLESMLFMRELPAHDTLRVVLRNTCDRDRRDALFEHVAADVAAIYRSGYHHKDCHLENVLRPRGGAASAGAADGDDNLIWIDNDLRYSMRATLARKRLAASLQQLVDTSPDFVSRAEWRYFAQSLALHLRATDLGRELAATTVTDFQAAFE